MHAATVFEAVVRGLERVRGPTSEKQPWYLRRASQHGSGRLRKSSPRTCSSCSSRPCTACCRGAADVSKRFEKVRQAAPHFFVTSEPGGANLLVYVVVFLKSAGMARFAHVEEAAFAAAVVLVIGLQPGSFLSVPRTTCGRAHEHQ